VSEEGFWELEIQAVHKDQGAFRDSIHRIVEALIQIPGMDFAINLRFRREKRSDCGFHSPGE